MSNPTLVLVPGLWLTADTWRPTVDALERLGVASVAPALPGVDDGDRTATLDDQVDALLAVVDAHDRPVVVAHSAASSLAWLVADRRPTAVSRVVLVGGFPTTDGALYADLFPVVDGAMAFPGWDAFDDADVRDLDPATRQRVAAATVPVAAGVARGAVRLRDVDRFGVPVTVVCPEYSPADVRSWIDAGHLPELVAATDVVFVDLDTGHWPQVTAPDALASILRDATGQA